MTVIDTGAFDGGDLDVGTAAEHIHGICLKTGPPRRVGVELEWLVRDARDPSLPVPAGRTAAAVSAFGAADRDHGDTQDTRDSGDVCGDSGAAGGDGARRYRRGTGPPGGYDGQGHGAYSGWPAYRADRDRASHDRTSHDRTGHDRTARDWAGTGPASPDGADRGGTGPDASRPGAGNEDADGPDPWKPGQSGRTGPQLPTSSRPGRMPSGAPLTAEPGGQLEISSLPADSLTGLVQATCADLAALRAALAADGLELAGIGLDPLRPPRRVLDLPRYAAMEAFFDSGGPWGRQMMGGTASVQVCLDAGDDSDGPSGYRWRWRLLHAIGPVLVAAFASSPLREGKPTGWVSSRQQVWANMDPGRTRPPRLDEDPRDAWAAYALDAQLMCLRNPGADDWSAPPGLTLRDWVRGGGQRPPTADDLDYHLSTLFPPVRPRGHFELRMIDAQPGDDGWIVPLAVSWALLADQQAGDAALAAVAPLWQGRPADDLDPWRVAARLGPADPATGRAGRGCFAAARDALGRAAVPASITAAVDAFMDRYVSNARCPADDLLEETQ